MTLSLPLTIPRQHDSLVGVGQEQFPENQLLCTVLTLVGDEQRSVWDALSACWGKVFHIHVAVHQGCQAGWELTCSNSPCSVSSWQQLQCSSRNIGVRGDVRRVSAVQQGANTARGSQDSGWWVLPPSSLFRMMKVTSLQAGAG